jgi:hypothetical protein
MSQIDRAILDEALGLLAELIEDQEAQHYVVCGGSSLLALGLIRRTTTKDVDVLASLEDGRLVTARPLPEWLFKAVRQASKDFGLMENWFNTGPSDDSFFKFGFPEGLIERLTTRDYGSKLRISYISRYDQIFFKLYATADSGPGRHYQDLQDLGPSAAELLAAARWTRSQDPSEGFQLVLGEVFKSMGHERLIDQL